MQTKCETRAARYKLYCASGGFSLISGIDFKLRRHWQGPLTRQGSKVRFAGHESGSADHVPIDEHADNGGIEWTDDDSISLSGTLSATLLLTRPACASSHRD